jgi:hypothetical protein
MDGEFLLDVQEIIDSVQSAEVMSLFFPTLRKALVVDTRYTDTKGPMIRLMPMVGSPQERLRSLRRLRPGFPRVRSLTVVPWPRYVDSLVTLGVWDLIVDRLGRSGSQEVPEACDEVLSELRLAEKAELSAVVQGENYHTIWSSGD